MTSSTVTSGVFTQSSGITEPVWLHDTPHEKLPKSESLSENIETDICVIGSGISGISIAYELVTRGREVVLVEAREILSGETARTTGHLSNALDDEYPEIAKKHGESGARAAAESHSWAIERVGTIASQLGIDCEYRRLPAYRVSQFERGTADYEKDVKHIQEDVAYARKVGINASYDDGLTIKGWQGKIDQRSGGIYEDQATFHPTKYVVGVLAWLRQQPNFRVYTNTRVISVEEKGVEILGLGSKTCYVSTQSQNTITCAFAVEATNVPLQKLSVIAQEEYQRTYAIAIRVPKGSVADCLIYDSADPYKYVRVTPCDDKDDYLVVGGCDHAVGQEPTHGRFEELEAWTRERFPQATTTDYKWSGQVFEPVDYMAYIGQNQGNKHIYIVTGDSGNGLTHGVLAGKLIADEITDQPNSWSSLYSPKRIASTLKSAPKMLAHDMQINTQYKRFLQSDITDIEDLVPGSGGVLNPKTGTPVAVYKDENGQVTKLSALCPHMKGVVCWNATEKSWDCPVHGSRFGAEGTCVQGPAKMGLTRMK
ncbi:FAD dependent oxidoreductase [Microdochium trichocladiopsis]|uniref:FAD dependent oxidoreductase n=1 Tax=Microdochium trichocladiopsis TaxID=1682393 RepID=A0A9P8Y1I1_9PEZI|nr:FAD dependent oxidoreductase [Microdochium trichocladiopsis]KAH7028198.1 FAD dependent oxidoreductase [Microdochium trichocladiopsis]